MFKAFTLIESLITLIILLIAFYFIQSTAIFFPNKLKIANEAELVRAFIYRVQAEARLNKRIYQLYITARNDKWCIIAMHFAKNTRNPTACNCLNLAACQLKTHYLLYQNHFKSISLQSNSLYPNSFMRINGISGNLETKCLALKSDNESIIIGFDSYGVIDVPSQNKRSECRF